MSSTTRLPETLRVAPVAMTTLATVPDGVSTGEETAAVVVERLRAASPLALSLAEYVSIASRIEPELLRSVRLDLLPNADASIEADVWLSPLMASRIASFAVMRADVATFLQESLARDVELIESVYRVIERVHHDSLPQALATEEELTYLLLTRPSDARVAQRFESILAAMDEGRTGLARWAARSLPRMPSAKLDNAAAFRVSWRASQLLGGKPILEQEDARIGIGDVVEPGSVSQLRNTQVGLRLFHDSLRITEPPEHRAQTIPVPETAPLLLELSWEGPTGSQFRTVSFAPGASRVVRRIGAGAIRVTTAAAESYVLEPMARPRHGQTEFSDLARHDGLTARAVRGDGVVLLAFDVSPELQRGLAGFSVRRTMPTGSAEMIPNRLSFDDKPGTPVPSDKAPLQTFRWIDPLPQGTQGLWRHEVSALRRRTRTDELEVAASVTLELDLTPTLKAVEVGFTRPLDTSNLELGDGPETLLRPEPNASDFDTGPYRDRYRVLGGSAFRMMREFLTRCLEDPGSTVDAFIFDLDHPDLIDLFTRLGVRLRVVLDNSTVHRHSVSSVSTRLKRAGCSVSLRHFRGMSFNKILIHRVRGEPTEVLTGSANFTINGLHAQHNHVLLLREPAAAKAYGDYFDRTAGTGAKLEEPGWIPARTDPRPSIELAFCPSTTVLQRVIEAVRKAKSSVLFSLGESSRELLEVIENRSSATSRPTVAGVVHSEKRSTVWLDRQRDAMGPDPRMRRRLLGATASSSGHGKYVAIDFDTVDAVVFAGSVVLSPSGVARSGGNLVLIRDREIATLFAIDALRMADHTLFRARTRRYGKEFQLDPTDRWVKYWFQPGTPSTRIRQLLIGESIRPAPDRIVDKVRVKPPAVKKKTAKK